MSSAPRRSVYCNALTCGWRGQRRLHAEPKPCPRCGRVVYLSRTTGGRIAGERPLAERVYFYPPPTLAAQLKARARAIGKPVSATLRLIVERALC